MADDANQQMRDILVLPSENSPRLHETLGEQIKSFTNFMDSKLTEYKEVSGGISVAVFAVNYVQNRFISTECAVEIAILWEKMGVTTKAEYHKAIESLKTDLELEPLLIRLESIISQYDEFISSVDEKLDTQLGPSTAKEEDDCELPELGVRSQTITHYVKGSAFDAVLILVVRSFASPEVNQYILSLYNKIGEFHNNGCDVFLLTRGPPIGSRGGSYIKLIGVPFRKLYDDSEAIAELKAHRRSAVAMAGWNALLKITEIQCSEEAGPQSAKPDESAEQKENGQAEYITQKGGLLLVNSSGQILYSYVEGESQLPEMETIISEVKKSVVPAVSRKSGPNKVQSELSVKECTGKAEEKKCCVIL